MITRKSHILDEVELIDGTKVKAWVSVIKVEINKGIYEFHPISEDWDKDEGFDETTYYHFLNIGLVNIDDET